MDPTIADVIGDAVSGFSAQLWLVAPIGLGIFAIMWGVPKAKAFVKRLSS